MFCKYCGQQLPDNARFCGSCGANLGADNPPAQQPQAAAPAAQPQYASPAAQPQYAVPQTQVPAAPQPPAFPVQQAPAPQSNAYAGYAQSQPANANYKSLGGWLLFFFVCGIIGVIASVVSLFSLIGVFAEYSAYLSFLGAGFTAFLVLSIILVIPTIVLAIKYLIGISKKDDKTLRLCQINYIYGIIAYVLILILANIFVGNYMDTSSYLLDGIASVAGLLLMTLYYSRSERVKVYFDGDTILKKAFFRF